MDKAFLKELREAAASEEFQAIRDRAEEADDDSMVVEYLMDHGLWEKYEAQRGALINYINNMDDVKYIYAIVWGDANDDHDMYLLDADDVPFYETGYYEEGVTIHDAMGVRYEASKHAIILNKMVDNLSDEEKMDLGFGKNGKLKEMLGHSGTELLGCMRS